ncbi:hypothetical protein QL987_15090 [Curtobacterium sp. APC 4022]|nr:hypothetical protein [Curtobacterium sp. APC 4022]
MHPTSDRHRQALVVAVPEAGRHRVVDRREADAAGPEQHRVVLGVRVRVADDRVERELPDEVCGDPSGCVVPPEESDDLVRGDAVLLVRIPTERLREVLGVQSTSQPALEPFSVETLDEVRPLPDDLEDPGVRGRDANVAGEGLCRDLGDLEPRVPTSRRFQDVRRGNGGVRPVPVAGHVGECELRLRTGEREPCRLGPLVPVVRFVVECADAEGDRVLRRRVHFALHGARFDAGRQQDEATGDVPADRGEQVERVRRRSARGALHPDPCPVAIGQQTAQEAPSCTAGA